MTAVEKLIDQLTSIGVLEIPQGSNAVTSIIEQAKEMEKEQMIEFASYYTPLTKEELEIGFKHKFKKQE